HDSGSFHRFQKDLNVARISAEVEVHVEEPGNGVLALHCSAALSHDHKIGNRRRRIEAQHFKEGSQDEIDGGHHDQYPKPGPYRVPSSLTHGRNHPISCCSPTTPH